MTCRNRLAPTSYSVSGRTRMSIALSSGVPVGLQVLIAAQSLVARASRGRVCANPGILREVFEQL